MWVVDLANLSGGGGGVFFLALHLARLDISIFFVLTISMLYK